MTRKILIFSLQALVTALLIRFLLVRIDTHAALNAFAAFGWSLAAIMILTGAIKTALLFLNWSWSLRINPGFSAPFPQVWRSFWAGLTLGLVFPGGYASFGKTFMVENTSRKATFASILFEKFYQGWVIWMMASIGVLATFTSILAGWRIGLVAVVALAPAGVLILLRLSRIDPAVRKGYIRYCPRILASQMLQLTITLFQYWLLITRIHPAGFWKCFVTMPLVLVANTIPITFGGLGLREAFAVQLLPKLGLDAASAVAVTLFLFLLNTVLPAIPGVFALSISSKRATSPSG
jgi:hypothetical protein